VQQLARVLAVVGAFSVLLMAVQPSSALAQGTTPTSSSSGQTTADSGSSQSTLSDGQRMRGPGHHGDHHMWGHGHHHGHGLSWATWSNPFWPWWAGMPIAQISALTGYTWPYPLFPVWPAPLPFWGF
jgi:hypothetical protein